MSRNGAARGVKKGGKGDVHGARHAASRHHTVTGPVPRLIR